MPVWGGGLEKADYDNGAALFPDIYEFSRDFDNIKDLLYALVIENPRSCIQLKMGGRKLPYYEMLSDRKSITDTFGWIKSLNMPAGFGACVEGLEPDFQRFYHYVLLLRYSCIIEREDFNHGYSRLKSLKYTFPESVEELCGQLKI